MGVKARNFWVFLPHLAHRILHRFISLLQFADNINARNTTMVAANSFDI